MNKKFFIFSSFLSLCALFFFIHINFIKRTKGFCLKKIISCYEYNSKWDMGPLTKAQKNLLDEVSRQPFFYLGSGKECYAFVSEDKKLVLKFFKQKHMKTQSFYNLIPFPLPPYLRITHSEKVQRRTYLRNETFFSYLIAYHHFSERTGLLYLHLNPTNTIHRKAHLIINDGKELKLELDKMEFMIQRYADKALSYIKKLVEENNLKEAKQAIGSILDLIVTRAKSGLADADNNCERNIGFIDGHAVLIDVGEFRLIPSSYPSADELEGATKDLREWLVRHKPELATFLDVQIQRRLTQN